MEGKQRVGCTYWWAPSLSAGREIQKREVGGPGGGISKSHLIIEKANPGNMLSHLVKRRVVFPPKSRWHQARPSVPTPCCICKHGSVQMG